MPNPSRSEVAALVALTARRRAAVTDPTVDDHPRARHVRERLLESSIERGIVSAHDDQQPGIGKRSRWQGFQELSLVVLAHAVRRLRVFQRLALTQVANPTVATAPGAEDLHLTISGCECDATQRVLARRAGNRWSARPLLVRRRPPASSPARVSGGSPELERVREGENPDWPSVVRGSRPPDSRGDARQSSAGSGAARQTRRPPVSILRATTEAVARNTHATANAAP